MNLKRIWIWGGVPALFLVMASCASGFTSMESVEQRRYIAIYTLAAEDYPDADDIRGSISAGTQKMPELSAETIERVFGALKFRRKSIWGTQTRPVFYKQELREIAPTLSQAIAKMKANQRMVFITRYDPDQSVTSRMERVTAMIWMDEAGLNLVLGEIRHEIPLNDFLEQDEWTEILPISMRRSFPYYALVDSPDYKLKKINGFTHGTWAIYKPENLASIRASKTQAMTPSDKGKLLRKALDNRIITRKEYDAKRKRIEQERRAGVLVEALDAGIVTPTQYDEKLREIFEGEEPPRKFLRVLPAKKKKKPGFDHNPSKAVDPEPAAGGDDKNKPLIVDKKPEPTKTDEKKSDADKKADDVKKEEKPTDDKKGDS